LRDGTTLIYTYTYSKKERELAEKAALLQDFVYQVQYKIDKAIFPELTAIFLEIKLDDGTQIFSKKYN